MRLRPDRRSGVSVYVMPRFEPSQTTLSYRLSSASGMSWEASTVFEVGGTVPSLAAVTSQVGVLILVSSASVISREPPGWKAWTTPQIGTAEANRFRYSEIIFRVM